MFKKFFTCKAVIKKSPKFLRHPVMRKYVSISSLNSEDYVFQLATSKEDLEAAYTLLHKAYVDAGYAQKNESGIRCTVYHAMPHAQVLVVKYKSRVVATVTLIKDGPMGLPSDKEYIEQNAKYRERGLNICEVSALAIDPVFRSGYLTLHLIKYLWHYTENILDCNLMCCVINPKALDFYRAYLNFEKEGPEISYNFVDGAAGVYITRNLTVHRQWMKQVYDVNTLGGNFYHFFYRADSSFVYPKISGLCLTPPVLTPEMLEYFFMKKTDTLKVATQKEKSIIRSAYALYFDLPFLNDDLHEYYIRPFRYPSSTLALLTGEGVSIVGKITNLGATGLFFNTSAVLNFYQSYQITFLANDRVLCLDVDPRWQTPTLLEGYQQGYGLQFARTPFQLIAILKYLHLNAHLLNYDALQPITLPRPLKLTIKEDKE